jgi:RHS repeat-associated protein
VVTGSVLLAAHPRGRVESQLGSEPVSSRISALLPDGRWLIVGGDSRTGPQSSIAIFDPNDGFISTLSARLREDRAGHTVTVDADGSVLIIGGRNATGDLLGRIERFDMTSLSVSTVPGLELTPRADHSVTLLTDRRLLIVGGTTMGGRQVGDAELLDLRHGVVTSSAGFLQTARSEHEATLLGDGRVRIAHGVNGNAQVSTLEIFDPSTESFDASEIDHKGPVPALSGSIPIYGATDVSPIEPIALRFATPIRVDSITRQSVVLVGPTGVVDARLSVTERGRLVFLHPVLPLSAGSTYSVLTRGLRESAARDIPDAEVVFTVASPEDRAQSASNDESVNGINSPWRALPPLQAPIGVTAVAGQVLRLNGAPLADVTLRIDDHRTRTDRTGRFLLTSIPAGRHELVIDGRTASTEGREYGVFEYGLNVQSGKTNVLPFTSWLPQIDTANAVQISSPTTSETIVSSPRIPNLELRLPTGTVVKDIDGSVVTKVSITPIPVDRTPFPLPDTRYVPIYFTIQPGGGYVYAKGGRGARLYYPNYRQTEPGSVFGFWHYDPEERGWHVYGHGQVTPDGQQIVPDPGVQIYEFTGAMVADPALAPPEGPPCTPCMDGDPVDLSTGLFVANKTDLVLPDLIPIEFTRTLRTRDAISRSFGIGGSHVFDMFLVGDHDGVAPVEWADLVLADGSRIHYVWISDENQATLEHTTTPSAFYKSKLVWNGLGWNLKMTDGTVYVFPNGNTALRGEDAALMQIRDRFGNTLNINRTSTNVHGNKVGDIASVTSGASRLDFTYDASRRITQVRDTIGRSVNYQYSNGRLWKVTDAAGGVTEYSYDSAGRMRSIKDPRGNTFLTILYDANSRVSEQTLANGGTYQFSYTVSSGKVTGSSVINPRGFIRQTTFNPNGYWLTDVRASGTPEQQTMTVQRHATSNHVLNATDTLLRQISLGYDNPGNLTSVTRAGPSGPVSTTATYEPQFNQISSITDPLLHTTTFGRSPYGSALQSVTDPLGHQIGIESNLAGQTLSMTDAFGTARFEHSRNAQVSGVTDMLSATSRYEVDGGGRVILATDPLGRSTGIEYSALNLPLRIVDPMGGPTTLAYDGNGNMLSVTDARNGPTTYTYDNMNRVATRSDALNQIERYAYDLAGNVLQYTDRRGQVTNYVHDGLDRLTQVTHPDGAITQYTYDGADRLTQVVDSVTGTTTLVWDTLDRLTSESGPHGTVTYTYDDADRRQTMTAPGQPVVTYTYDDNNQLTQVQQGQSIVTLAYDTSGRRTSLTLPNNVLVEYGYDARDLTSLTYKHGSTVLGTLTYAYDANGRRTNVGGTLARTRLPLPLGSATYNAANQLTQWDGRSFSYDANGNLTSDGARTFGWDARNQMTGIGGLVSASFQYDPFGRRQSRVIDGIARDLLHDGGMIVQEMMQGNVVASSLNGLNIDEVFSRTDSSGTGFVLADALGSTLAISDGAGLVAKTNAYTPFGATATFGESSVNATQFTGRDADATGLYYYRARYYDPTTQRFLSEDPIGFAAGDANLYSYVFNDPTNLTDPSGELPDALIDAGFIGYDLYKLATQGSEARAANLNALGLDVAGLFTPGVTGLGMVSRGQGQLHHAISKKVFQALERSPLAGKYALRAQNLVTRAKDLISHCGYQKWHRDYDKELAEWIQRNRPRTKTQFEDYLRNRYNQPDLRSRFPNGLP